MDSYITWPYQIAYHHFRITWVYNKYAKPPNLPYIMRSFTGRTLEARVHRTSAFRAPAEKTE